MIKEVGIKRGNTKTGYEYTSIEMIFLKDLPSAVKEKVYLLDFPKFYFNEINKVSKKIEIKIKNNEKIADVMPIYIHSLFWCVSKKFKNIFEDKLKGYWWETNNENYFIFLLDNVLDLLDKENTEIVYSNDERHNNMPWMYKYIENEAFKYKAENEYVFTLPECFGVNFCSTRFEQLVIENHITGLQMFKDLNFKRKDKSEFDPFRRKKYDEDGNCLD